MDYDPSSLVPAGVVEAMFRRYALLSGNPSAVVPHYDGTVGEYDNLSDWWNLNRDGGIYGVKLPLFSYSNTPDGIKTNDNYGLMIEPSTQTVAGRDDYAKINAFKAIDVNATIDANGVPHVTAIEGDGMFARDGSNGDVWVMVCNGFYRIERTATHKVVTYSDTQHEGMRPMPGGQYPDGSRRPFLLFSKYAAWLDTSSVPHSWSGKPRSMQFGCQSNNLTYARKKGAGYSGRTLADNFYLQLMFMLKYGTQNSQKVGGCSDYSATYKLALAEANVNRVVLTRAQADYFVIGSAVNVGTSSDRNQAANYSVAENRRITRIEAVDAEKTALYIDGAAITTTTDLYVTCMPWFAGSCDGILGIDGYPVSGKATVKQPYRIQGIEFMVGVYEVVANVIMNSVKDSEDAGHVDLYACFNSTKYAGSITSDYVKCDLSLPPRTLANNASWQYAKELQESANVPGWLVPQEIGATSTTGTCDAVYSNPITSVGLRELLCFASLWHGGLAGVWAAHSDSGRGSYGWACGGRLSGLGISKPSA